MLASRNRAQMDLQVRRMRARVLWWFARRILRGLGRQLARLENAWQQDVAREQLRHLSDRMLRDVGLQRSEIDGLFRRA